MLTRFTGTAEKNEALSAQDPRGGPNVLSVVDLQLITCRRHRPFVRPPPCHQGAFAEQEPVPLSPTILGDLDVGHLHLGVVGRPTFRSQPDSVDANQRSVLTLDGTAEEIEHTFLHVSRVDSRQTLARLVAHGHGHCRPARSLCRGGGRPWWSADSCRGRGPGFGSGERTRGSNLILEGDASGCRSRRGRLGRPRDMAISRSRKNAQHGHHESAPTQQSTPDDQYPPPATPAAGLRARAIGPHELLDRRRPRSRQGLGRWRAEAFIGIHSPTLMSLTVTRRLRSSLTATLTSGPRAVDPTMRARSTPCPTSHRRTASTRR